MYYHPATILFPPSPQLKILYETLVVTDRKVDKGLELARLIVPFTSLWVRGYPSQTDLGEVHLVFNNRGHGILMLLHG